MTTTQKDEQCHPFKLVDQLLRTRQNEKGQMPDYAAYKTDIPTPTRGTLERISVHDRIVDDVTQAFGQTPLVRMDKLAKKHGLKCNLLAKTEFISAGGSIKDRIALRMILRAEAQKEIKPGDVIVEATSGNTGIGLALVCAVRGYHCLIVMPKKMSAEKANVLLSLGAKLVRTRSSAQTFESDSHLSIAYWLVDELNKHSEGRFRTVNLDQYKNYGNVEAHYNTTAVEIIEQTQGKVSAMVAGAGTGGTLTGIGLRLKQDIPGCRIIGVDPSGSVLHEKNWMSSSTALLDKSGFELEGIGYDFHPSTFRHDVVDEWVVTNDRQSLLTARDAIRTEGVLCGGSSGAALHAAIEVGQRMKEGENLVVILPDSIRNYLNKFVSDDWMLTHCVFDRETEHSEFDAEAEVRCKRDIPLVTLCRVGSSEPLKSVYAKMIRKELDWVAVLTDDAPLNLLGVISKNALAVHLLKVAASNDRSGGGDVGSVVSPNAAFPISRTMLKDKQELGKICLDLLALNRDVTLSGGVLLVTNVEREPEEPMKAYRTRVYTTIDRTGDEAKNDITVVTLDDLVQSLA